MSQPEKTYSITEYQLEKLTKSPTAINIHIRNVIGSTEEPILDDAFEEMQDIDRILCHIRSSPAK